jgi:hypothetical protein
VHSLQQLPRGPGNGAAPQLLFGAVDTWAPSTFVPAPGALVAPGAFGAVLAPGSGGVAPGMVPSRLCSDERTQHHNAGEACLQALRHTLAAPVAVPRHAPWHGLPCALLCVTDFQRMAGDVSSGLSYSAGPVNVAS